MLTVAYKKKQKPCSRLVLELVEQFKMADKARQQRRAKKLEKMFMDRLLPHRPTNAKQGITHC